MMQHKKFLLVAAILASTAVVPNSSQAQGSRSDKSEARSAEKASQGSKDEFDENRRLHMEKSKENNTKKNEN